MLDASFPVYNPVWAHSLTIGDLVRCQFPAALDYSRRQTRLCAVSDVDRRYGAHFVELVPAILETEQAPETGDIRLDQTALAPGIQTDPGMLWLRPDIAERFDTAHAGFQADPFSGSPVLGRIVGAELAALEQVRARHLALREAHIADRRARRAQRRRAR